MLNNYITNIEEDLYDTKNSFNDYQLGRLPYNLIKDHYVLNTTGEIKPYNGWDCTNYIPVNSYKSIYVKSSVSSGYNVFYNKDKQRIADFIVNTEGINRLIPDDAYYVVMSNTAAGMLTLEAIFNRSDMIPRNPASSTVTLASLADMGVYNISRAIMQTITDKPNDADDAVATLINYSGAYAAGAFTIQRLVQLPNKEWERVIRTTTHEVSYDWRRIYNYSTDIESIYKSMIDGFLYLGNIIANTYIDATNGREISYNEWDATDFVEIPKSLKTLVVNSKALSTFNVFYDNNKAYVSSFKVENGSSKITIPAAAKYFRLSNTSTAMQEISVFGVIKPEANILNGKKLVTAGDSYTAASWAWSDEYKEYDGKNFGYYIAQRNGMSFVNAGISGSTMAIPTNGVGHNPFVVDRYLNIPADTDYLTIWFGINDAANCTLGTIDDEADNTFYGAWNKILRYYLTNRPWLKILIIVTVMANPDIRQATRNIAQKWGYPYLDWEKDVSIPAFFMRDGMCEEAETLRRDAYGYNGPNEGHPNPQWYEYISTIIEAKLRAI